MSVTTTATFRWRVHALVTVIVCTILTYVQNYDNIVSNQSVFIIYLVNLVKIYSFSLLPVLINTGE